MSRVRQAVFPWESKNHELPEDSQQRCRELLSELLLAVVRDNLIRVEEESDER